MIETRATGTPKVRGNKLVGIAAPFDSPSVDLGGFTETIKRGAFAKSLDDGSVIFALHHHDTGQVLASTRVGSLSLRETARGLEFDMTPADTSTGRDVLALAKRGDLAGMSFGFRVRGADGEAWKQDGRNIVRELRDLELFEVSTTAFPAYPSSTISTRANDPAARMRQAQHEREKRQQATRQRERRRKALRLADAHAEVNKPLPAPEPERPEVRQARIATKRRKLASR